MSPSPPPTQSPPFSSNPPPNFQSPTDLLTYLYADLTRLSEVSSPSILLHRHDARLPPLRGIAAAQAHEEQLVAAARGTLRMDVERIIVGGAGGGGGENGGKEEQYATVYGWIRARKPGIEDLAVRFRGVWRFGEGDGRVVEHWENVEGESEGLGR